jgi:4-hydroxy-4-methyl-2-oxoglutarate aldolase
MDNAEIIKVLRDYPTSNLCNAHSAIQAMSPTIKPLFGGIRIAGPAKTAVVAPGQNAAIHRAVHTASCGQVLVVDGGANRCFGPFGDILATCCRNQGIVGAVIDSTIRDVADIKEMQFPVYSLGANPAATEKTAPGSIDVQVICGGLRVRPGDIIVGDDDGVVVIPVEIAGEVADRVQAVGERECEIKHRLANGLTTCEIFEISI